jgi:tetratricopeptide (TPR) repeat protein
MRFWVTVLAAVSVAALADGEGPPSSRPPWQRLLQGDDAKKAAELLDRVQQSQQAGKWDEALRAARELLELRQRVQGKDHWETADVCWRVDALQAAQRQDKEVQLQYAGLPALDREGEVLEARGRYREAQAVRQKALEVRLRVLGEKHPHTAYSCNGVAASLHAQGRYKEAEEGYRKALDITRATLGEDDPKTGTSHNNVAANLNAQGRYREAEQEFKKALEIQRKVFGEESPHTASCYNNVATNLNAQGRYKEGEESCRKALAIFRNLLGEEHVATATCLNNVAVSLAAQGQFREAEELYRKALGICRKVQGEEHPDTARCYGNLAGNLSDQGHYREAEEAHRKALDLKRKVLGEDHPSTAESYNNLAHTLNAQARYREAEEGFQKALDICRRVLGEGHPLTAQGYNNVAFTRQGQGRLEEAEAGYRKALETRRKVLGEEHPETARSYNNVAFNLRAQRRYSEAEEVFRKALGISRKVLGEEHPDAARSCNNLAFTLAAQGRYREADEYYRQALDIWHKLLGENHPLTAACCNNLAANLHAEGRYPEAEQLYVRGAEAFLASRLHIAASGLGRAPSASESSPLLPLAALLAHNGKPAAAWLRLEQGLGRGAWDDLTARLRWPAREQARQTELVTQLDRLDQLVAQHLAIRKPTAEQERERDALLDRRLKTQDELTRFRQHLEESYGPAAGKVFDREQIQAALSADAALIAWIDIAAGPKAADANGERWVVLLRSAGLPIWERLQGSGPGSTWTEEDTRLPARLRTALLERDPGWQRLAARLREQRLGPQARHLAAHDGLPEVKRLVVLPSALLAGVPVEVIAEGLTVSYAHSGTLYAHLRQQPKVKTAGLLAVADPVFEPPATATKEKPLPPGGVLLTMVQPGSTAERSRLRPGDVLLTYNGQPLAAPADLAPLVAAAAGEKTIPVTVWREDIDKPFRRDVAPGKLGVVLASKPAPEALTDQRRLDRRLTSRGDEWRELPGTRAEAAAIARLFAGSPAPLLLTDSQASEQKLSELAQSGELNKYRYLHLASHAEVDDVVPLRSAVILSRDALPDPAKQLLAGAPVFDGRLTAQEVLEQWNLDCELVTLSACQTALGKYEKGEGHVGFAQALILCGSRSVCLSLWKVDDSATALLMERFYANLIGKREGLKAPLPKAEALAEARRWLRTLPREQALKHAAAVYEGIERGKGRPKLPRLPEVPTPEVKEDCPYAHPYYWAAFVLTGDPE